LIQQASWPKLAAFFPGRSHGDGFVVAAILSSLETQIAEQREQEAFRPAGPI